jgi:hypothetical protein
MNASWFANVIASANETLTDRRLFLRHAAGLLVLGAVLRFAYLSYAGFTIRASEAFSVAAAFAARGELADAWGPDTGLTAHLSPGMPLLVGEVYRWLGVGTPAAEFLLACISLAFITVTILALDAAFERLGAAPLARFGAIALLCLLPLNIFLEMRKFRHWEGALAAAGIAVCLARSLKMDGDQRRPSWLNLGVLAFGASVLSLFSEAAALACFGIIGWLALRRRGWLGFIATTAVSAALISALSYPWAVRNEAAFGEKVWTRTAFGFNFAVGFHDKAISPADPLKVYSDRMVEVSPSSSPSALAALQSAGGEVAYGRLWTARTEAWVGQHPLAALKIAARHIWEFYMQPRWMWWPDKGPVAIRVALLQTFTVLGFAGLATGLACRDWRYIYVAAALVLPMFPYVLGQPLGRYRYPVDGLLVFLAADLISRAARLASNRQHTTRRTGDYPVAQKLLEIRK